MMQTFERTLLALHICLVIGLLGHLVYSDVKTENALEDYIRWFHERAPRRVTAALSYAPDILTHADVYEVDPLLVATVISFESSWRSDVFGKRHEVGLMQILPGSVCAWGQRLDTPSDQIRAGTRCLAKALQECGGDLRGGLTMYASGYCEARKKRTELMVSIRIKHYKNAITRFRKE